MSVLRLRAAVVAGAALALLCLGSASAVPANYGGALVVGLTTGSPSALDPTISASAAAVEIELAMCERLYATQRNHGRIVHVPELAAALPTLSKDKLSYVVPIRRGIVFNDGTPLDAQAVATSMERLMTYPTSSRATDYASVARVTADGPYTVVFHLKARDSTVISNYMFVFSPTAIASEGDGFASAPVCVGPFMLDHQNLGTVTLVKSPYYYNRDAVHLDKIVYEPMTNSAAATAALEAGDVQVIDNVDTTELPGVDGNDAIRVVTGPELGWEGLLINIGNRNGTGVLPFQNVGTPLAQSAKLRQAFEEAIDRKTMNRVVFGGLEQTSCTPITPGNVNWYSLVGVPCTKFDPAGARRLVAQSGVPDPTVHLQTGTTSARLRLAQFIQAEEKAVGINVVAETSSSGTFDVSFGGFEPGADGDPNSLIAQFFQTTGARNATGYSNPRLDYVLTNGLKATDIRARAVNYRVAQQILLADRPTIFLYNQVTHAAFRTTVRGIQLYANGLLDVRHAQLT
jgi:peptide/nickel transport system substrate-binding protein